MEAELQLSNNAEQGLTDISVTLEVRALDGTNATALFAIGAPRLSGITGVDGTGERLQNSKGHAKVFQASC